MHGELSSQGIQGLGDPAGATRRANVLSHRPHSMGLNFVTEPVSARPLLGCMQAIPCAVTVSMVLGAIGTDQRLRTALSYLPVCLSWLSCYDLLASASESMLHALPNLQSYPCRALCSAAPCCWLKVQH